jgi:hypothetical protein
MRIHCESNDKMKERSSARVRFRFNLAHSIRKRGHPVHFLKLFPLVLLFLTVFVISF